MRGPSEKVQIHAARAHHISEEERETYSKQYKRSK
jgi:hypothetical protein